MSDIDFDELDREVNKLVNQSDGEQETPNEPTAVDSPRVVDDSTKQVQDESHDGPQLSTKPRGRFMDVVHPSSDMSTSEEVPTSLTPSSERKSLSPLSLQDSDTASQSASDDDTSKSDVNTAPESTHVNQDHQVVKPQDTTDMPDPIEVHEALRAKSTDEKEADTTERHNSKDDQKDEDDDNASIDQPSSAFLADAQVEKRPLGKFSEEPSGDGVSKDDPVSKTAQAAIDQANGKDISEGQTEDSPPEEPILPLPPELEKDLVAIEAGESPDDILSGDDVIKSQDMEESSNEAAANTDTVEKDKSNDKKIGASDGSQEADDKAAATTLLASGSIPQQYKIALQQKVEGSDDPKQLFAAEHHATGPSRQAGKQHSKAAAFLQWVLIVVGVLLLGATIGAGLYVFVSNQ